jgi:hypothetical protein
LKTSKLISIVTVVILMTTVLLYMLKINNRSFSYDTTTSQIAEFIDAQSVMGTKENPRARHDYEFLMTADPTTNLIPDNIKNKESAFVKRVPSREFVNRNHAARSTENLEITDWQQRGPYNVGGRTRALAIDVKNEDVILSGGVSGGMWRSENGGKNWVKVTSPESHHSVTCIVQDTRPGKEHIWYYGTGELQGNSARGGQAPYRGDGIFKSGDNGRTWGLLPSTSMGQEHRFNSQFQYIWNIIVNKANMAEDEVLVAAYGGILRSKNGGTSWEVVLGRSLMNVSYDLNNIQASEFTDIAIAPDGSMIATLSRSIQTDSWGIFISPEGKNWKKITPSGWPSNARRTVLAIAPSNNKVAYFITDTKPYRLWKYVYNDINITGQWEDISDNLPDFGDPVGSYNSQSSYNMIIKVHPADENVIFLGGTNLYRSKDGFASTSNTSWIGGYDTLNNQKIYANHYVDQHALVFYPSNTDRMLSGNDGGIFITENNRAKSVSWKSLNNGYFTSQFYTVAIDKSRVNNLIIGGMQDNGSYATRTMVENNIWSRIIGGDGGYCAISENGYHYYFSFQNGETYRIVLKEDMGMAAFTRVDPAGAGAVAGQERLFVNPFVLDPGNNNRMYYAGGDIVWRNDNLAQIAQSSQKPTYTNWKPLEVTKIPIGAISALNISTIPSDILYYGTTTGKFFKIDEANDSPDELQVLELTNSLFPNNGFISYIAIDPSNADHLLVVFSNYNVQSIFHSNDGGDTFQAVGGNLEENISGVGSGPSVRTAKIIPLVDNQWLYLVGTSSGVFSTTQLNGHNTEWAREGQSIIGNIVVPMITYRSLDGLVAVATHGNGVYIKRYDGVKPILIENDEVDFIVQQNYPNPFALYTTMKYSIPQAGIVNVSIYNTLGQHVRDLLYAYQYQGDNEVVWDGTNKDGAMVTDGIYFAKFTYKNKSKAVRLLFRKGQTP